jgi:hypothetical protein
MDVQIVLTARIPKLSGGDRAMRRLPRGRYVTTGRADKVADEIDFRIAGVHRGKVGSILDVEGEMIA